jgi:creatinine amidohydrolase
MDPYILAETNYRTLKDQQIDLAVLPWGATEAHNYHLPYATDNILIEKIAAASAKKAWDRGGRVLVLPGIPFGVNTGQLDIRVNINLNPGTQMSVLNDIADVLNRHGIFKFLILNGHGGNDFKQQIRELGFRFPKMFISTCDWYRSVNQEIFEKGGGHADEMETSMMLFLAPELVLPLSQAGEGKAKEFRIKALNGSWAWAERRWTSVTSDTGIGDPSRATPGKGKECFGDVVNKIGDFMYELSVADINDLYE